jgi:2-polyprenyl-3-methyl-5-hydroxy-6-metoxy-1,4-benzoquinol methylase
VDCCSGLGYDEFFDEKLARRDARRYRRKGIDGTAREIVGFVTARGVDGASVLEVGGGTGTLQLELLRAGARHAVNLELSRGYDSVARELAQEAGVAERVERRVVDIAERPDEVSAADIVVLHRVVCCYPQPERLVGAAAAHAERLLVLSFPRRNALSRLWVWGQNLFLRLSGRDFQSFVHRPETIRAAAVAAGLRAIHEHRGRIWHVAAFERP